MTGSGGVGGGGVCVCVRITDLGFLLLSVLLIYNCNNKGDIKQ